MIVSQEKNGALIFQASKIMEGFGGNKEDSEDWKTHKLSSKMLPDIVRFRNGQRGTKGKVIGYGFGLYGEGVDIVSRKGQRC